MKRFFTVVHCVNEAMARKAVDVAFIAGADGVFLINQGGMAWLDVLRLAHELGREDGPLSWMNDDERRIGVNILGASGQQLQRFMRDRSEISMCWADNATAFEGVELPGVELFGGVAFKYQDPVPAKMWAPRLMYAKILGVQVATTSGLGTGMPADVTKVRRMVEIVRELNTLGYLLAWEGPTQRLALASGVSLQNVADYLPHVDDFIVGSSIESSLGVLEPAKVQELGRRIREYESNQGRTG